MIQAYSQPVSASSTVPLNGGSALIFPVIAGLPTSFSIEQLIVNAEIPGLAFPTGNPVFPVGLTEIRANQIYLEWLYAQPHILLEMRVGFSANMQLLAQIPLVRQSGGFRVNVLEFIGLPKLPISSDQNVRFSFASTTIPPNNTSVVVYGGGIASANENNSAVLLAVQAQEARLNDIEDTIEARFGSISGQISNLTTLISSGNFSGGNGGNNNNQEIEEMIVYPSDNINFAAVPPAQIAGITLRPRMVVTFYREWENPAVFTDPFLEVIKYGIDGTTGNLSWIPLHKIEIKNYDGGKFHYQYVWRDGEWKIATSNYASSLDY